MNKKETRNKQGMGKDLKKNAPKKGTKMKKRKCIKQNLKKY